MRVRAARALSSSSAVSCYKFSKSSIFLPSMATDGKLITILSIDGGGVKGIIPAEILDFLESELQELDQDKNVRLADYFDFIAGTSTGGLVTTMLSTPDSSSESNRPVTAKQIIDFYLNESPVIFPQKKRELPWLDLLEVAQKILALLSRERNELSVVAKTRSFPSMLDWFNNMTAEVKSILEILFFPKYDNMALRKAIEKKVGNRKLHETLTNVIISSFDIKLLQPTVFTTSKAKRDDFEDVPLVDVCLSTSAAPTFLPLHEFKISTRNRTRSFNMVDGGVVANNPTLLALTEATKQMSADGNAQGINNMDCTKLLVLSLGCGSSERNNEIEVSSQNWGPIDWLVGQGNKWNGVPFLDVLMTGAAHMVDIYVSSFFRGTSFEDNYLRIQTDSMKNSETAMDNSSEENLANLQKIGKELLKSPVSTVDLETGLLKPIYGKGTNEEALKKFAKRLSDERKRRQDKKD